MELSVSLNVGGKIFMTSKETLQAYPDTLLGNLVAENKDNKQNVLELTFDRNPKLVYSVLDFYRTGELHLPRNICAAVVERELRFWRIPSQLICQCCWKSFKNDRNDEVMTQEIDNLLEDRTKDEDIMDESRIPALASKIWLTMEYIGYSPVAKIWHVFYFGMVFYSVLTFVLETVPVFREIRSKYESVTSARNQTLSEAFPRKGDQYAVTEPVMWLMVSDWVCFSFFLLEFLVRLLVCPRKLWFFRQCRNCLDLLLLVHTPVIMSLEEWWIPNNAKNLTTFEHGAVIAFYSLVVIRTLRIFQFAKDFDTMKILWLSAKSSTKELLLLVICVISFVSLFGAVIYTIEFANDTYTFASIPAGMWWAIITMTTVGYGDVYPVSVTGQMLGAVCALFGVIVIAMPVAILVSHFTGYHANMSSQKQMRTTLTFLKHNPQFCKEMSRYHDSDGGFEHEDERGEREGEITDGSNEARSRNDHGWTQAEKMENLFCCKTLPSAKNKISPVLS